MIGGGGSTRAFSEGWIFRGDECGLGVGSWGRCLGAAAALAAFLEAVAAGGSCRCCCCCCCCCGGGGCDGALGAAGGSCCRCGGGCCGCGGGGALVSGVVSALARGLDFSVSSSAGVVTFPARDHDGTAVLERASRRRAAARRRTAAPRPGRRRPPR